MDKSIVAVEESQKISDPQLSASKSLGSLVQINSIAIDISCAMEDQMDQSQEHEHFSIRGFVAGMRKKDSKICSPFGLGVDNDDSLPPLSVPRFRWWQCSNCVPNIVPETTSLEMLMADRSQDIAGTSNSCQKVDRKRDIFFSNSIQIGDEIGEENVADNKIIKSKALCAEGHKATTCSKAKADVMDNGSGSPNIYVTNNNTAVENPPDRTDEQENASSGSDGAFSALPYRRKPKLRSLADIMEEERNSLTEHPKIRSSTSTEIDQADLNPQSQSDILSDISARGNRSPQRKRKIVLDEEPIERLKGPTPDAEKRISDSESEGNLNIVKAQPTKMKKQKALDVSRKMRQTHVDNRGVLLGNAEMSFGNTSKETSPNPYFMSFISGQEMDRVSNMGKNKRPESQFGDCNIQGKVALDLSLNSYVGNERKSNNQSSFKQFRGIPDLNESFTERTTLIQGKQLAGFSDKRSVTLPKNLDMTASCSKEPTRDAIQNMENSLEPSVGASDDIPMEIVELLAKNQRERALGNSRKQHLPPENLNNTLRGSPNFTSNNIIDFPNFTRNVPSGKMGPTQGILKYPQDRFSFFRTSFTPTQQIKTSFSASNPNGTDLLWPPRRKNMPFHLNVNQNRPVQPNGLNFHPFPDKGYKGKTISDMKGQEKKHKSVGSLDAYSNDTIPAMQLLSLMDRGIVSGSSYKVGSSSFLDKPFSPCNHHPRVNSNENKNNPFLGGSSFSLGNHSKEFPGLLNSVRFSGENLKKSAYLQGQKPPEHGNSKGVHLAGPADILVRPSRTNPPLEICTLNRNPADFSFPDARNEYTISAKDLRPRKRNTLKERPYRSLNVDGRRRHRLRIDSSRKECSRK